MCQNLGGDLGIVRSADHNSFLSELVRQKEHSEWGVWLGFGRRQPDLKFYWVENTRVDDGYTNWRSGEPNNVVYDGHREDCGNMIDTGEWNDLYCNVMVHPVFRDDPNNIPYALCEKKPS